MRLEQNSFHWEESSIKVLHCYFYWLTAPRALRNIGIRIIEFWNALNDTNYGVTFWIKKKNQKLTNFKLVQIVLGEKHKSYIRPRRGTFEFDRKISCTDFFSDVVSIAGTRQSESCLFFGKFPYKDFHWTDQGTLINACSKFLSHHFYLPTSAKRLSVQQNGEQNFIDDHWSSLDYQGVYNGPINNCKIINHCFF